MKLYRLEYRCYARKAQMVLDLLGSTTTASTSTSATAPSSPTRTGGYVQVPVLVDDGVPGDRRLAGDLRRSSSGAGAGRRLVPSPWQGPIWAYADWCDGPLEDVMFRIATPLARATTSPIHGSGRSTCS